MEVGQGRAHGPDADEPGLAVGYPRLLALLDELDLRASFFIEGWNALHHPDRVLDLAQRGHEIGLHGWVHEPFATLGRAQAAHCIDRGLQAFARLGLRPLGFRAPGAQRGPHAAALLAERGLSYDSSTDTAHRDDPEAGDQFVQPGRLTGGLAHVPWRHAMVDSIQYLRHPDGPRTPAALQARWLHTLARLAEARATTTLVLHAHVSFVDDARFAVARQVLGAARRRGDIEIIGAATLAARLPP